MAFNLMVSSQDNSHKMEYYKVRNGYNELMACQQTKTIVPCELQSAVQHIDKVSEDPIFKSAVSIDKTKKVANAVDEETVQKYKNRSDQNGLICNGKHTQNGTNDDCELTQNGLTSNNTKYFQTVNNGKYVTEELQYNYSKSQAVLNTNMCVSYDEGIPNDVDPCSTNLGKIITYKNSHVFNGLDVFSSVQNGKKLEKSVLVNDHLTSEDLQNLFANRICVLHIPNYIPQVVCDELDSFLQEKGSDPYTHEIRGKDGTADLQYFGVNRYGHPLNSTYNDGTEESLKRYFSEALPTMQAIRRAASPYLSPIDKLRVEMDELWNGNVNVATLNGRKTFCGIGRIMPASLSELSADQPHFDAVPTSYFPNIRQQFAANIYLNVPGEGGELEIWDVPPVDVDNAEEFTIPEDWRSKLPKSIKVKPGPGDLLLLNTRRPHAITKFAGSTPRTSIQTFIGLTKESNVFLWV